MKKKKNKLQKGKGKIVTTLDKNGKQVEIYDKNGELRIVISDQVKFGF